MPGFTIRNGKRLVPVIASAALLWGALTISGAVALAARPRQFTSGSHGISAEAPTGWELSTHTGYPWTLVLFLRGDDNRISIAARETDARHIDELVRRNRTALEAQKFVILESAAALNGGHRMDAKAAKTEERIRQIYFLRPWGENKHQAIVITLACPPDEFRANEKALDQVLKKLTLHAPAPVRRPDPAEMDAGGDPAAPDAAP